MAEQERLQQLFEKYLARQCNPAELQKLISLLQDKKSDEELNPRLQQLWRQVKDEGKTFPVDWENMYARITKKEKAVEQKKTTVVHSLSWRMVAVFTGVIILSVGLFVAFHSTRNQKETPPKLAQVQHPVQQDLKPGGDKAVLTLGDGTKIILDSAGTGTLAQQGNTKVIKLDSGQLAYRTDGKGNLATKIEYNTLSTPRGGQFRITLPDGSKVWLNAASSIRYPTVFTGSERDVAITGEAYFEVAHRPDMPFVVTNGTLRVQVFGTHFNVNAYDDEEVKKITLLEGSVKVDLQSKPGEDQQTMLKPDEQAIIPHEGVIASKFAKENKITILKDVDADEVVAWKNGVFEFNNEPIQSIMRQVSRWYDVQIEYKDSKVPVSHFTGAIQRHVNISEVLKMLELTHGVSFRIEGRKIIVIPT